MFYQSKTNKRLEQLTSDVVDIEDELMDHDAQIEQLRNLLAEEQSKLNVYTKTMGPLWKTREGHRRPMGMLSSDHLGNLLKGNWLRDLPEHRIYAEEELRRREIDIKLREAEKRPGLWSRFWGYLAGEARSMGLMS